MTQFCVLNLDERLVNLKIKIAINTNVVAYRILANESDNNRYNHF